MNYLGMIRVSMLQAIPMYADLFIDKKNLLLLSYKSYFPTTSINSKINSKDVSIIVYFGVLVCHHSFVSAGELKLGTILSTISTAFIMLANALQIPEWILKWNLTISTYWVYAMFSLIVKNSFELCLFWKPSKKRLHTLRVCYVFFDGKKFPRIILIL